MLTRKQHELICFIADRLKDTGVSPSFEEMKEALALKSKSGVHRLISALEERNFIRRLPNRARAAAGLRMPERPLQGPLPGGRRMEAPEGKTSLSVPAALLGPGEHFALEVAGDSMVEA